MVLSWVFTVFLGVSLIFSIVCGRGSALSAAVNEGAQKAFSLAVTMGGALCLWSGAGNLMEKIGLTASLGRLMAPLLNRVFPECRHDDALRGTLSANVCANLLGLGNAATPMGIRAAKMLQDPRSPTVATHSLCRLVVLNTASIQLLPTNVAAVRSALGCGTPFDILVPVWITSLCSAGLGLGLAVLLGKVCKA
jgi:spore maturation protein A